jgi:crotonobetainyl-CoA:carnitine CoA-transferase CaiB-like acyl-CoA transferase
MQEFFKGIKVLELAGVLAGPSVGMFFAELGCEVIKVENPASGGDVTRSWKLPSEDASADIPAYFSSANWGKKSLTLDLKTQSGRQLIYKLIAGMDIVLASYKSGDAQKLGMDYGSLKKINPKLIYASISGYGEDDPRIAYDAVLQAESGFMSMNGTPESGPLKMPVAVIDLLASHQLREAILIALLKRQLYGEGSHVRVSLLESALVSLANQAGNYLQAGFIPGLQGSEHPNIAPYGDTFRTQDGQWIILAIGNDRQFRAFAALFPASSIGNDPALTTNALRVKNRPLLREALEELIGVQDSKELIGLLKEASIPAGLVKKLPDALAQAPAIQLEENGFKAVRQIAFQGIELLNPARPPHLGEHTKELTVSLEAASHPEM